MDSASLRDLGGFEPDEMLEDLDQIAESPKVSLRDLYYRWERTNWSAQELDFTQDVADWNGLGDDVTERLLWVMSMFFHGEECVTATLAPWVDSAPDEEMQLFLATQLADEARHTVFFDRFFGEVVGAQGDMRDRLAWSRPRVSPGFEKVFYEMLPAVAKEVRDHPRDPVVFARGVAMYHILLEGTLAVPGQKYILAFCRDRKTLPAFRSGFTAVARDESRHVGAGVRILQDLIRMDGDAVDAVQQLDPRSAAVRDAAVPTAARGLHVSHRARLRLDRAVPFRAVLAQQAIACGRCPVPEDRADPSAGARRSSPCSPNAS